MIAHIQGKLTEKSPTEVVIDCGGVGYCVHISLHTYSLLPESEHVKLYTHQIIREDAHLLYGFAEKSEREIFVLLLTVSGIGSNTARTMLSSLNPTQIKQAIVNDNVSLIQGVKGIGIKTAQRVILDLKDKVLKIIDVVDMGASIHYINKEEALSALEVLGITRKVADKIVEKYVKEFPEATTENIIKQVLKNL